MIRRYNIEMSDENYLEVMKNFDPDGGGQIEYNEFLSQFGAAIAGGTDGPGGISAKLQHGDETEDRHGKSGGASKPAWGFVTGGGGGDSDDPMGSIGASDGARVGFAPKLPHWPDVKACSGRSSPTSTRPRRRPSGTWTRTRRLPGLRVPLSWPPSTSR